MSKMRQASVEQRLGRMHSHLRRSFAAWAVMRRRSASVPCTLPACFLAICLVMSSELACCRCGGQAGGRRV